MLHRCKVFPEGNPNEGLPREKTEPNQPAAVSLPWPQISHNQLTVVSAQVKRLGVQLNYSARLGFFFNNIKKQ